MKRCSPPSTSYHHGSAAASRPPRRLSPLPPAPTAAVPTCHRFCCCRLESIAARGLPPPPLPAVVDVAVGDLLRAASVTEASLGWLRPGRAPRAQSATIIRAFIAAKPQLGKASAATLVELTLHHHHLPGPTLTHHRTPPLLLAVRLGRLDASVGCRERRSQGAERVASAQ